MKTLIHISISLIGLLHFACSNPAKNNVNNYEVKSRKENTLTAITEVKPDTIYKLLQMCRMRDSFLYGNENPFCYIKTGYFLSSSEKNAVLVSCGDNANDKYKVGLYTLIKDRWIKNDELDGLDAHPIQFYILFNDYNFDKQKDIYIQSSMTNGIALSRGHLLTIDPKTKKFLLHPEVQTFANMNPDPKSGTVYSEKVIWCKDGSPEVSILTNKWIKGKLKTIKHDNPCEME